MTNELCDGSWTLDTWGHFRPSPRLCHGSRHLQSPAQLWSCDPVILVRLLGYFLVSLFAPSCSLCVLVPLTTCSLFSQRLTSSLPSSASATSANAPHRDSRLPSSFKHHSWRSPPVLFMTWDLIMDRAKGKFGCVGLEYFHKFCFMLLCLSLRKTPTIMIKI